MPVSPKNFTQATARCANRALTSPPASGLMARGPQAMLPSASTACYTRRKRTSSAFLSTVLVNVRRDWTIREKYNVVTRSSETRVAVGYTANVIGFGWTNGVFLPLLHELPKGSVDRLSRCD